MASTRPVATQKLTSTSIRSNISLSLLNRRTAYTIFYPALQKQPAVAGNKSETTDSSLISPWLCRGHGTKAAQQLQGAKSSGRPPGFLTLRGGLALANAVRLFGLLNARHISFASDLPEAAQFKRPVRDSASPGPQTPTAPLNQAALLVGLVSQCHRGSQEASTLDHGDSLNSSSDGA